MAGGGAEHRRDKGTCPEHLAWANRSVGDLCTLYRRRGTRPLRASSRGEPGPSRAISATRYRLALAALLIVPASTVKSSAATITGRPSMVPEPMMTASAGASAPPTSVPNSANVRRQGDDRSGSERRASLSRCLRRRSSPPMAREATRRLSRSSSMSGHPSGPPPALMVPTYPRSSSVGARRRPSAPPSCRRSGRSHSGRAPPFRALGPARCARRCRAPAWSTTGQAADRPRWRRRSPVSPVELIGGYHCVHHTQGQGLRRAEDLARKGDLFGLVDPDSLAEEPRGAEVEAEPPLGEDGRKSGPFGAPDHVGRQRKSQAGPHAHAVDLGDDRYRAVVDREHHVAQDPHGVKDVARATRRSRRPHCRSDRRRRRNRHLHP